MTLNAKQLAAALSPETIALGEDYLADGRVLSAEQRGGVVFGRVRGAGGKAYQVVASIKSGDGGEPIVAGHCSCRMRQNCKHVAALLLAVGGTALDAPPAPGSEPKPEGAPRAHLSLDLRIWLDRIADSDARVAANDPNRILYLLSVVTLGCGARRTELRAVKARRLADGGYGATYPLDLQAGSQARFVEPVDRRIMAHARALTSGGGAMRLDDDTGPDLLRLIAGSGRGFWQHPTGPVLRLGEPRQARLAWRLGDDAMLRVALEDTAEDLRLLPMAPPWYLDTATGDFGPLETGLTDRETGLLVSAPPVPAGQSAALAREYRDRILHISLPLPPVPERQRIDGERPTPVLRLASAELVDDPRQVGLGTDWYADDARDPDGEDLVSIDYALLLLDYGGTMISPDSDGQRVERVVDGRVVEIGRDLDAEREAIETLEELGFDESLDLAGVEGLALVADDEDWIDFMRNQLPRLREAGWRIGIAEDFAFRITPAGDLQLDIDEPDGGRWLDIALGIDIDGERQDLLPVLLELLQDPDTDLTPARLAEAGDDAEQPVRLADGRLILLPVGRLRPILSALVELYDPDARLRPGGRLRLSRLRAGELAALEEANSELRWQGGDAARDWARRLAALGQTERVAPPAGLDAELRAYQHDGLDWLQGLRALDLGGILADDMGLGKTIQTLAHLLLEKASGRTDRPSLVVAPTSLMFNWTREAARFTPDLRVLLLHGPRRSRSADAIASADLVLTTYALLPRDLELLSGQRWHVLILDEAQAIKNPRAKAAQAARALDARQRLCLTGTPLENHLGELWALLDFLLPDLLGDERRFRRLFRTPIERQGDAERAELLRRRIAPFLLRRTKEQVAAELPPKTEIPREVPLARDQRDLYETLRLSLHEQVQAEIARKGLAQSGIVILDALLKLRQCCCDPRLVSLPSAARVKGSAKLDLLMELLPELLDEGRQVLLFSQFTGMLKLIEEALAERLDRREGRDYVKLTGRTRDRATPVDRFQAGEVPLFLISLKAGGAGLNLTAADTVIHYDPWWNPAAERQATDRAHRIGQDKPVFVYKLLTEGTVEQRVAELQARKQTLADAMLAGGGSAAGALSADDLALLLAPLD